MDLRPELLPPLVVEDRLEELMARIERIADLAFDGEPADAAAAIAEFNALTGHNYGIEAFHEYDGERSLLDFAREAARPAYPKVADVTHAELVEIVHRIWAGGPDHDYYVRLFDANVAHPRAISLILHPPEELWHASAEEIVDAALSYRPIAL